MNRVSKIESVQNLYQLLNYQLQIAIQAFGSINPLQESSTASAYINEMLHKQNMTFEDVQHYYTLLNMRRLLGEIYAGARNA